MNPLQTTESELGIVSSRVALLLRSAEIKPTFHGFVGVNHLLDVWTVRRGAVSKGLVNVETGLG
jgi:hypothetical protein